MPHDAQAVVETVSRRRAKVAFGNPARFDPCAAIGSRPESPFYVPVRRACVLHATLFAEDFGGDPRPRAPTDRRPWLAILGDGARFDSLIPRAEPGG